MTERINGYAEAMIAVAQAENSLAVVKSQMVDFAEAVQQNEALRASLGDAMLPVATRNQIIDDLLAGKALDATRALVGMVVAAGHGSQLSEIVEAFITRAATASGRQLAVVRSAVALSEDQKGRLATALEKKLGVQVELQNVVDPNVVGGAITTIGDTVLDGSVSSRLQKMHETL